MKLYNNQEIVTITKENSNSYKDINLKTMNLAMKDLTPTQFQVWLYFAIHANKSAFIISPAEALKKFGIKKDSFQKAKRALKEKGYLIKNKTN